MRKKIIKSNWINLFAFSLYLSLFFAVESIINDYGTGNIFSVVIGDLSQAVFFGLFFPLLWGLPFTIILGLLLILTDLLILKKINGILFITQTTILIIIFCALILFSKIPKQHLFFIPAFAIGQFFRFKRLLIENTVEEK
ncbi:MAG TPA: hypothetical protein PK075_10965 [Chitinophagales bacterium]|nr:hypothetical protein [Chitinophagales bacterium]